MTVTDYQIQIGSVVLGPGTNYIVHNIDGFGIPAMRANDVMRPRDHGEFYGLDYLPGRTITITLTVRGNSDSDVVANLETLLAAWQPVAPTVDADAPLSFKFPGQSARQFLGRPRRASADTSRIVGNKVPVVLEYKTADPRQYAVGGSFSIIGISAAVGGRSYPRTYPLAFGGGSSASITATNSGNFSTRPVALIAGPITNPRIENVTTGEAVKLAIALTSTDTLTVDFDARTIVLNGTASRYSALTSDSVWWELAPGNSLVRLSADSYDPAATLSLSWASAWI